MATVVSRATSNVEVRYEVKGSEYDPAVWLIDPDLSAVAGVPNWYWKVVGNDVLEMTAGEKAAVDAAILGNAKGSKIRYMAVRVGEYVDKHYNKDQQASLNALWTEGVEKNFPNRNALVQSVLDWVKSVMDEFYSKKADVIAATTTAQVDAIQMDLAQFDGTDPHVTVEQVKNTNN